MWGLGFGLPYAYSRPDETAIAGPAVQFLSGDLRPSGMGTLTVWWVFAICRRVLPDSIILQRSPLVLYSNVPDGLERIVGDRYALVRSFRSAADDATRVYDQQDALFLPLAGLAGVDRMGPSFEIYRLRGAR
jgi:hypothetical protein